MRSRPWRAVTLMPVLVVAFCRSAPAVCRVRLSVSSELPCARVPMDPVIDFGGLMRDAGLAGVLAPNSIGITDARNGRRVPHATTSDLAYGDCGRIEWVIEEPSRTEFTIHFRTADQRPPLTPAARVPLVGVGDLLRYNAGAPGPVEAE